ncbi:glutamate racemase [Corticibacter populi]|uniref:Glutamate racemase n=1 Tax=Corticibacter populi TaxID=1550736 RepID=A0A3M6QYQ9_9BURK|nr:glutamate racemase [Corticibacter populi]RMX08071.1 glutamate racemase [Corticibacter populi]RZS35319.1 glutamate racemase [Corticibacter populi]
MCESDAPIGVFDSGVGGLSILRALRQALPAESFVYFSDAAHAPYGERDDAFITARSSAITETLLHEHRIKALVVACNTATAAAIHMLRQAHPGMPIIGVEPAVKPALLCSRSGRVAVLATQRTLASDKYRQLLQHCHGEAQVLNIACNGLAGAIERDDTEAIHELCNLYLAPVRERPVEGTAAIDTVVLGCTHYPFVLPVLQALAPPSVRFLDPAVAVAAQTIRRLSSQGLLHAGDAAVVGRIVPRCSGNAELLHAMLARHIGDAAISQQRQSEAQLH